MTSPQAVSDAIDAANAGRLIVLPTDTVYGIGTRADRAAATSLLFEAKGREQDAALPVFVSTADEAARLGLFDDRARLLAAAFWPGALTIVLPRTAESRGWNLGGTGETIGLRVPGHPLARTIAAGVKALAISSANRSGEPVLTTCDELSTVLGSSVEMILCEEKPLSGSASTVVDASGDELRIVREGTVSLADIERALAG